MTRLRAVARGGELVVAADGDAVTCLDGAGGIRWRAVVPDLTDAALVGGHVWCAARGTTRVWRFDLEGRPLEPFVAPAPLGDGRWQASRFAASIAWCGEGAFAVRRDGTVALRDFEAAAPVLDGRWLVYRAGCAVMVHAVGEVWSTELDSPGSVLVDAAPLADGRLIALVIRHSPEAEELRLVVLDGRVGDVILRMRLTGARRVLFAPNRAAAVVQVERGLEVIDLRFGRTLQKLVLAPEITELVVDETLSTAAILRADGRIEVVALAAVEHLGPAFAEGTTPGVRVSELEAAVEVVADDEPETEQLTALERAVVDLVADDSAVFALVGELVHDDEPTTAQPALPADEPAADGLADEPAADEPTTTRLAALAADDDLPTARLAALEPAIERTVAAIEPAIERTVIAPAIVAPVARELRDRYLDHAQLTAQLQAWAASYPELVRLSSLGETPEGREIWLAVVGREPDRVRPTVWIAANGHAPELAGTSAAVAAIEAVLRVHLDPAPLELAPPVLERLRDALFYITPRLAPDGAEAVLGAGAWDAGEAHGARWLRGDLDGDGRSLALRVADAGGDLVDAPDQPGVLIERDLEHAGPYYKLYPEGAIEGFDGMTVPAPPGELSAPSAPAFAAAHPEIFAAIELRTCAARALEPVAERPDFARALGPAPLVLGEAPGAVGLVVWDVFARLGLAHPVQPALYPRLSADALRALVAWDANRNAGRAFPGWRPHDHAQLGPVEVGGYDPRIGIWNPPLDRLAELCDDVADGLLHVAAQAPRLRVDRVERRAVAAGLTRVAIRIANDGYLATSSAADEPVRATAHPEGCALVDPSAATQLVGHLDGWGRRPGEPARGSTNAGWVVYLVHGTGALALTIGSPRTGAVTARVEV